MSEKDTQEVVVDDELATLKQRADMLRISYHANISVEKLRAKVNAALEGHKENEENTVQKGSSEIKDEMMQLVRVRIACMNPVKKEWEGEIFDVGNSVYGTVKKYVPFNVEWHVPKFILQMIQERKFQTFYTEKINGQDIRRGKQVAEFAVEILPPLTEKELKELAQRQAMAKGKE